MFIYLNMCFFMCMLNLTKDSLNVAYLHCNGVNLLIREQLQEKGAAEALAFKVSGSSVGS